MISLRYCLMAAALMSTQAALAAPRQVFAIPITGQMFDGTPALGQATGMSDGKGLFLGADPGGCLLLWLVERP